MTAGPAASMHSPELGCDASSPAGPQPGPGLHAGTSRLPLSRADCPVGLVVTLRHAAAAQHEVLGSACPVAVRCR